MKVSRYSICKIAGRVREVPRISKARIRPRAQVHLLCTAVRYWRGRGDAISVLSGLVTTPSRFQWEERVVYERCTAVRVERKCIMHAYVTVSDTAGIRGRLRYTSSRYAARNHASLCDSRAHELYFWRPDDGSRHVPRFDRDLGTGREWPAKCLPCAYKAFYFS